jgi:hypothetical protein
MVSNRPKFKVLSRVVTCLVTLTLATNDFSHAERLGNLAAFRIHPILQRLAAPLDEEGIDVIGGDTGQVPLGERPRVALLSNMRINIELLAADYENLVWMRECLSGTIGITAAVSNSTKQHAPNESEFMTAWQQAHQDKRIFLSFTSFDLPHAAKVKGVLEANEYVIFTFLNKQGDSPKYDAVVAGKLFREAGNYIVFDTPNARISKGVWLETSLVTSTDDSGLDPALRALLKGHAPLEGTSLVGELANERAPRDLTSLEELLGRASGEVDNFEPK